MDSNFELSLIVNRLARFGVDCAMIFNCQVMACLFSRLFMDVCSTAHYLTSCVSVQVVEPCFKMLRSSEKVGLYACEVVRILILLNAS